MNYRT